MKIQFEVQLID